MENRKPTFIRQRLNSFGYAGKGLAAAFRSEVNLRWHVLSGAMAVGLGWYLGVSRMEWVGIVTAIGLVWMAELFNTALEVVVNLVSPDRHPLAGKAKDIAAAAVLMAAVAAAVIGGLVFLPHLCLLLKTGN